MNFWKYLLKNRLWILLSFLGTCGLFIWAWQYQDVDATLETKWTLIGMAGLVTLFLGASYVAWKRSRP